MFLDQYTGRGVRIAVIDSGVHADHPHIVRSGGPRSPGAPRGDSPPPLRGVLDGIAIRENGSLDEDYVDRLGHGTAVTAAIREKAPAAEIVAIKVFWKALTTDVGTLVLAIDEAAARRAQVINLSLGTAETVHRDALSAAVGRAAARGSLVVSAIEDRGVRWLPGSFDNVVGVRLDWACPREAYRVVRAGPRRAIAASGYPRDIPGVPRERNLKGVSFAVANASGFVARALEASPGAGLEAVLDALERQTTGL